MQTKTKIIGLIIIIAMFIYAVPVFAQEGSISIVEDVPTVQSFTDDPVSQEDIVKIVTAGVNAPSAMNGQPWHFSVVTDSEVLQDIAGGMGGDSSGDSGENESAGGESASESADGETSTDAEESDGNSAEGESEGDTASIANKAGVGDSPAAIIVSCRDGSEFDAGLACQTMSIEALLLGYGTKIVSSPTMVLNGTRQDEFREILGIPSDMSVVAVILIGIPAVEEADAVSSATARSDMSELVSFIEP